MSWLPTPWSKPLPNRPPVEVHWVEATVYRSWFGFTERVEVSACGQYKWKYGVRTIDRRPQVSCERCKFELEDRDK